MAEQHEPRPTGTADPQVVKRDIPIRSSHVSIVTPKILKQPSVTRAHLTLTRMTLEYGDRQHESGAGVGDPRCYLLEDVVGVVVNDSAPSYNKVGCQMNVHLYPKKTDRRNPEKSSRKMAVLSICFDHNKTMDENKTEAIEWKKNIKLYSYKRLRQVLHHHDMMADVNADISEIPRRHLLVLINPVCGQGKAVDEFRAHVEPLFKIADISLDVIVTERQNHARDLMKEYDLSSIEGIAITSGDGLLYEVVNGMMEREDWEQALRTPIGMLPTGSGNALCASSLYEAGEEFSLVNAAFQIIQGGVIPMDITTVETADKQTLYMTLLSSWGMVADIDIESEKLRKIGDTRFVFGALNCIRKKRIYRGKLIYLPYDGAEDIVSPISRSLPTHPTAPLDLAGAPGGDLVTTSLKPELLAEAMSKGRGGDTEGDTPLLASSDGSGRERSDTQDVFGEGDVVLEESSIAPLITGAAIKTGDNEHDVEKATDVHTKEGTEGKDDSWELVKGGKEKPRENPTSETVPTQISSSSAIPVEGHASPTSHSYMSSGPKPHLLPDITEATPDNWKVIEGEFLAITPLMIPHMTSDFFGDPSMSIGTGRIRIMYIQRMSRFGMLGLLAGGSPANKPDVNFIDVKAYRLEPYTEEGILTIDGEAVKYGPVQAQVHQHLARVFCSKRAVQDAVST